MEAQATHHNKIPNPADDRMEALDKFRSAASISMTPELFEKLYLSPYNQVKGSLRQTFGNPTPIALIGFLLSLTPLSCDLMGWRGAGGGGAATIGVYFFMGGLLMVISSILEWVVGNSFPSVVFATFGGFWLSYGATLHPSFAASSSYSTDPTSVSDGLQSQGFNASFGFWILFMNLACIIFFICALRTNIVFVALFFSLIIALCFLNGAYWAMAEDYAGNSAVTQRLLVGAGACAFVTSMAGWYLFASIMLAMVDFPIQLPVGDLTGIIKGKSDKARR